MARPVKVLSKKEIENIIDKKIREAIANIKITGQLVVPGKRGRPVGWCKKKR